MPSKTVTPKKRPAEQYDRDYYENGVRSKKSNYVKYRWLPQQTLPFARAIIRYLGIQPHDTVQDFGAARGYLVRALRQYSVNAWGYDISKWAIKNCDPTVKDYMSNKLVTGNGIWDFLVSKDCFEHIPKRELDDVVPRLFSSTTKALFIIVPLTTYEGGPYLRVEDQSDPTHIHRLPLCSWIVWMQKLCPSAIVNGSYCIPGVKPAAEKHPLSCGFITARHP